MAERGPIDNTLQPLIDQAIADLATRLAIDSSAVITVSAASTVWPDKGVGCPQPGMQYNQVLVDGTLIELSAGGITYRYHSGGGRAQFLCEQTAHAVPTTGNA